VKKERKKERLAERSQCNMTWRLGWEPSHRGREASRHRKVVSYDHTALHC
jgi:hypothetical protein